MKSILILLVSALLINSSVLIAQEQVPGEESTLADSVTNEELEKYAIAMDSINAMKSSLLAEINAMVKENGKMTAARYNDLSKIMNDEAKLTAAKATPEEIKFMKEVAEKKSEGTAAITQTFQSLAKDYIGAATYNKIKKALEADAELKSKYEAMLQELEKGNVK